MQVAQDLVVPPLLLAGMGRICSPTWRFISRVLYAQNLVSNGSFESGFTGWVLGGTVDSNTAVVINYNSTGAYPISAHGESVAPNNSGNISPDVAGAKAAYFVSDFSSQNLTQTVHLRPGTYQIGLSAYAPNNGYVNSGDGQFTGSIAGVTLANYSISSNPAATWQTFYGERTVTSEGDYLVQFSFVTNSNPSKDVVIDRVYVAPAPVPEPEAYAMLLCGLGLIGAMTRRRMNKKS